MSARNCIASLLVLVVWSVASSPARAEDWPTYRHDNRRSGVTSESLETPLTQVWEYRSSERPQTAWAGPAKWDSYADIRRLKSMRNFDPVYYVTIAGDDVFFGSSVDDAVHCLDLASGREKWVFFTDGPVRLPPSFYDGRLYFGSDDGHAYCIRADSGQRLWRHRAAPDASKVPINGKLTALYPCRTGVLVQDAKAYFAASLLPWEKTYLCAVDAESGAAEGEALFKTAYEHLTAQGPLLASATKLYVSQGRQTPLVFERATGRLVQNIGSSGFGGVFGLLTEDSMFVHGYGQNHGSDGELRFFDDERRDLLVTFPRATCIVIDDGIVYLHADGQLQAFDRDRYVTLQCQISQLEQRQKALQDKKKKLGADATDSQRQQLDSGIASAQEQITTLQSSLPSCFLWRVACDGSLTLILAGDTLFAGGEGSVAAHDMTTGRRLWTASVDGRAYGLAVAGGSLLVSTDLGSIVCLRDARQ